MKRQSVQMINWSLLSLLMTLVLSSESFAQDSQEPGSITIGGATGQIVMPGVVIVNPTRTPEPSTPFSETAPPANPTKSVPANPGSNPLPEPAAELEVTPAPKKEINEYFSESKTCSAHADAAFEECDQNEGEVGRSVDSINRSRQQQSSSSTFSTGAACGQLANDASSAVSSVRSLSNACASKVNRCRSSCAFLSSMNTKDQNYGFVVEASKRCSKASGSHSSMMSMLDSASRSANDFSKCYQAISGQDKAPTTTQTTSPSQNYQNQQLAQQQANCALNPRGCGLQQNEPFTPTNMAPAALPRDSGTDKLPTIAGPGNVRIPFDGTALMKDDGSRRSRGGDDGSPRGGGGRAGVASDFKHGGPETPKKKNAASPAERVAAEIYKGYMSPGATDSAGVAKGSPESKMALLPLTGKPIVGNKIAPSQAALSKFTGKAQELRQIWAEKLRASGIRGLAGSEHGAIPVGADGLTGPHTENFKKIRGRFLYLERTFAN